MYYAPKFDKIVKQLQKFQWCSDVQGCRQPCPVADAILPSSPAGRGCYWVQTGLRDCPPAPRPAMQAHCCTWPSLGDLSALGCHESSLLSGKIRYF